MNILFLGYWNVDDPLTSATVLPHLEILKNTEKVENVLFVNTQREEISGNRIKEIESLGVKYHPLFSKNFPINLINKVYDFIYFPQEIKKLVEKNSIHLIIARGAPAGGLAYLACKKCKIPFIVESFEPHASYMLAAGTWKFFDPRFLYQTYLEKKQREHAKVLITVSNNYRKELKNLGVDEKRLMTAPCAVDPKKFFPDKTLGRLAREELCIPLEATVGVYAGKFGGLYYEDEAFQLFDAASKKIENFYLLLLTPHEKNWVQKKLKQFGTLEEKCVQIFVAHQLVNKYLNAADFAFAPIKKLSVSAFQSPVKTGEFWSVGLPVLMTAGIGDEALFIEKEGMGCTFNIDSSSSISRSLDDLLPYISKVHSEGIRNKGLKYRNFDQIKKIYKKVV